MDDAAGDGQADGLREFTPSQDFTGQLRVRPDGETAEDTAMGVAHSVENVDVGNDNGAATVPDVRFIDKGAVEDTSTGGVRSFDLDLLLGFDVETRLGLKELAAAAPLVSTILNSYGSWELHGTWDSFGKFDSTQSFLGKTKPK